MLRASLLPGRRCSIDSGLFDGNARTLSDLGRNPNWTRLLTHRSCNIRFRPEVVAGAYRSNLRTAAAALGVRRCTRCRRLPYHQSASAFAYFLPAFSRRRAHPLFWPGFSRRFSGEISNLWAARASMLRLCSSQALRAGNSAVDGRGRHEAAKRLYFWLLARQLVPVAGWSGISPGESPEPRNLQAKRAACDGASPIRLRVAAHRVLRP